MILILTASNEPTTCSFCVIELAPNIEEIIDTLPLDRLIASSVVGGVEGNHKDIVEDKSTSDVD